jgi:hypothetical protein
LYTGLTPEEMDQRVTSYNEYATSTPLRAFHVLVRQKTICSSPIAPAATV